MSNKKPTPLFDREGRACCPVCGITSYSAGGIHPQCASRREDEKRMSRVRLQRADESLQAASVPDTASSGRKCPECRETQRVRMRTCECGYVFDTGSRPPVEKQECDD